MAFRASEPANEGVAGQTAVRRRYRQFWRMRLTEKALGLVTATL
jgi:hypothetical protein